MKETQAQKMEIAALKSELEKTRAATTTEVQLGSNGDGPGVEANSQDLFRRLGKQRSWKKGVTN